MKQLFITMLVTLVIAAAVLCAATIFAVPQEGAPAETVNFAERAASSAVNLPPEYIRELANGNRFLLSAVVPAPVEGVPGCEHIYKTETIPVTCTSDGYTLHVCEACGSSYADDIVEALYHNWKYDGRQGKGLSYVCTLCGETLFRISHSECISWKYIETVATCVSPAAKVAVCTVCGEKREPEVLSPDIDPGNHVNVTAGEKEERLCDASASNDGVYVSMAVCEDCGKPVYRYRVEPYEPEEDAREVKLRVSVEFEQGTAYQSAVFDGAILDAPEVHPEWQSVIRGRVYDKEGYCIRFTYLWHDAETGECHYEEVDVEQIPYTYFTEEFREKVKERAEEAGVTMDEVCWVLQPDGDRLMGFVARWMPVK